jgi:hypothetical protein
VTLDTCTRMLMTISAALLFMKSGIFTVLETREEPQKAVYYF